MILICRDRFRRKVKHWRESHEREQLINQKQRDHLKVQADIDERIRISLIG